MKFFHAKLINLLKHNGFFQFFLELSDEGQKTLRPKTLRPNFLKFLKFSVKIRLKIKNQLFHEKSNHRRNLIEIQQKN